MDGPRRRFTLYDQIIAVDGSRRSAGFTLDDLLSYDKVSAPPPSPAPAAQLANRTLSDTIRDNEPKGGLVSQRDRRSWNLFKDRLRLKRASAAALSNSLSIPTSDIPVNNSRTDPAPSGSVRRTNLAELINETARPEVLSVSCPSPNRFGPPESTQSNDSSVSTNTGHSLAPIQISSSTRLSDATEQGREGPRRLSAALAEERALSDREAAAAQTAAVQGTFAEAVEQAVSPMRMSLTDLLEETERPLGWELGPARYVGLVGEVKGEEEEGGGKNNGGERQRESEGQNCCVCMVRNKGAAFIPCGHTFCRQCSREVWVSRGNCPLCNGFILEILDIF